MILSKLEETKCIVKYGRFMKTFYVIRVTHGLNASWAGGSDTSAESDGWEGGVKVGEGVTVITDLQAGYVSYNSYFSYFFSWNPQYTVLFFLLMVNVYIFKNIFIWK